MTRVQAARHVDLDLLDVLEQLPRDVLRQNLWLRLTVEASPGSPLDLSHTLGRAFRLVCSRTQQLTDQLTRRLHVVVVPVADSATSSEDEERADRAHGLFLARQEGLQELTLQTHEDWEEEREEEERIAHILQLGGATSRRLQVLNLHSLALTKVAGQAVRLHCTAVRELDLVMLCFDEAFFTPLHGCHSLTKVSLCASDCRLDLEDSSRVLAALPSLTSVALHGEISIDNFTLLAAFTGLEELILANLDILSPGRDGAVVGRLLGALTRLTSLETPSWSQGDLEAGADPHAYLNAVAAQLGGLPRLASLFLTGSGAVLPDDPNFAQDALRDTGFAALRRLTALTSLTVPAIELTGPASAGHLPQLQHLCITNQLRGGGALAATLQPLQPLPQLRTAELWVDLDHMPAVAAGGGVQPGLGPTQSVAAAADAMWPAASMLADAPLLKRLSVTLGCVSADNLGNILVAIATAPSILMPLHTCLTQLRLWNLKSSVVATVWPALSVTTCLDSLNLGRCSVSHTALLRHVGHGLPSLRRLAVIDCPGVSGDSAAPLAVARGRTPLRLVWCPPLSAEQACLVRELAGEMVTVREVRGGAAHPW